MIDEKLTITIAKLYYFDDLNQKQIAEKLGLSLASVSRYITRAKKDNIVEIKINESADPLNKLERELEKKFGLRECLLVPTATEPIATYRRMAEIAGPLLERLIKPGDIIGVSWGETLKSISTNVEIERKRECHVIPIIGGMGKTETAFYTNAIARNLAQNLGGINYLLNCPAVLDSREARDLIKKDSNSLHVLQLWDKIDTALVSVSDITESSSVYRYGIFTRDELSMLKGLGIKGAINFNFFDLKGSQQPTDFDERIINLSLNELKKMKNLIISAAGTAKTEAILSFLKNGLPLILISDENTAKALISKSG